eukprot:952816_1
MRKTLFTLFLVGALLLTRAEEDDPEDDGSDSDDTQNFGTVIGIDLGTTYSCVGVMINGKVEIIPNDQGNRRYSDKVVQKDIKLWPFEVLNKDGKPYVKVVYQDSERTFAPE